MVKYDYPKSNAQVKRVFMADKRIYVLYEE